MHIFSVQVFVIRKTLLKSLLGLENLDGLHRLDRLDGLQMLDRLGSQHYS